MLSPPFREPETARHLWRLPDRQAATQYALAIVISIPFDADGSVPCIEPLAKAPPSSARSGECHARYAPVRSSSVQRGGDRRRNGKAECRDDRTAYRSAGMVDHRRGRL